MLKCEVIHKGYKEQQIYEEVNLEEAQLNLSFKPDINPNITYYGMEPGEPSMVKVMFHANPKPSSGQWIIGDTEIEMDSS